MKKFAYLAFIFSLLAIPVMSQVDPLREKLQREQAETYQSEAEGNAEYDEATNPKRDHDDPDYFEHDHSIKPNPLPFEPME